MAEQGHRAPNSDGDVQQDRRRPGRVRYANPSLIRMLRRPFDRDAAAPLEQTDEVPPAAPAEPSQAVTDQRDDLAPAHGVFYGAIWGAFLWVIIGAVVWFVLGH